MQSETHQKNTTSIEHAYIIVNAVICGLKYLVVLKLNWREQSKNRPGCADVKVGGGASILQNSYATFTEKKKENYGAVGCQQYNAASRQPELKRKAKKNDSARASAVTSSERQDGSVAMAEPLRPYVFDVACRNISGTSRRRLVEYYSTLSTLPHFTNPARLLTDNEMCRTCRLYTKISVDGQEGEV